MGVRCLRVWSDQDSREGSTVCREGRGVDSSRQLSNTIRQS